MLITNTSNKESDHQEMRAKLKSVEAYVYTFVPQTMWNQDQKLVHLPPVCIYLRNYLPSETYLEVMCSYEQVMLHQHCVML